MEQVTRTVRAPAVAGVTETQRNVFRTRLFNLLKPMLRSGRLGPNQLASYRATLRLSSTPAWLASDVRNVLDQVERILAQPDYEYDPSLAGDFGDFRGLWDWVETAAGTVWGGVKSVGTTVYETGKELVPEYVKSWLPGGGNGTAPGGTTVIVQPPPTQPTQPSAPAETKPATVTEWVPVTTVKEQAPGLPTWAWIAAGLALYLFVKK